MSLRGDAGAMSEEMKYRLYGDHRSGNCYKPAWMLHLTGRPFDWTEVNVVTRETRTPDFLALNPNGRVPVLRLPDGRYLSESNAMLIYLAEGTPWIPEDAYLRALAYQWLFFEQYSHEPYIAVARFIVQYSGTADEQQDRLKMCWQNGRAALEVMETRLSNSPFLAGDAFSIADIALYAYTHTAEDGGFELEPFAAVRAWLDRVSELPEFTSMEVACR